MRQRWQWRGKKLTPFGRHPNSQFELPPSRPLISFALFAVRSSGVMILGPESIPEPELHTFSEIDDSDSNSDSRKKWNHNTYRGVMIPWLESIPESEPIMGMIPIPVPIPRKNGIITPLVRRLDAPPPPTCLCVPFREIVPDQQSHKIWGFSPAGISHCSCSLWGAENTNM